MKRRLLLSLCILSLTFNSFSQVNKAFAITGNANGDFQWMSIRQIDLATGAVVKNIFEKGVTPFQMRDALTGQEMVLSTVQDAKMLNSPLYPTATMVAAAAYDKKHNRLFFTPMSIGALRWVDLSSDPFHPKFYSLQSAALNPGDINDEANHFTRMTIGADGYGYALTNDANHLVKFSTGKKVVVIDLGALIDASTNDHISIHNKCSSWGGDMVADAMGNLYLFTASKNVFKIDLANRVSTYVGSITGLSGVYTLNGAAVDNDDNVIVSSANTFEGFYKVNMKDLSAVKLITTGQVYNASDLANSNLLFASQARNTIGAAPLVQREIIGNQYISIYPNPVFGSDVKVTFDKKLTGDFNIVLTDIQGKVIVNKPVFVKSDGQVETVQLKSHRANGMYLIKVTNSNQKSVFADKIVFE